MAVWILVHLPHDVAVRPLCGLYVLGAAAQASSPTLFEFFDQVLNYSLYAKGPAEFVHATRFPNLSIMPSHPGIAEQQVKLESRYKIYKLRETLAELTGQFDEVYIDTPPALNFYSRTALIATDRLLIPFDCDSFSRQALYNLVNTVAEIREDHNEDLIIEGVVINQYNAQARLPNDLIEQLKSDGLPVLESYLTSSVKLKESREVHTPLIHFAPNHKLTRQFVNLYHLLEGGELVAVDDAE